MTATTRPLPENRICRARCSSTGRRAIRRRAQRGQTLIVALGVLFVLLFIGGIFVTQVARNLTNAGRTRDTQTSQSLAEAGIRYCDDQLSSSIDGADWRTVPSAPITTAVDPLGLTDPDYQWLSQGFTRQYAPGGRYLIRVTYEPRPDDPRSQFIKIDSIGRTGDLGQGLDPTVFVQSGSPPRLRRELVAYKQMGLPDYLMYVTNKDLRTQEAFLGTPAIGASLQGAPTQGLDPAVVFNDPSVALHPNGTNNGEVMIGGGIRVNGNLRLGGDVFMYFSPRGTGVGNANISPEGLFVSNSISLLPTRNTDNGGGGDNFLNDNDLQAWVNQDITAQAPNPANAVRASTDPNFSTVNNLVRDGSSSSDTAGFVRSIPRLDPPLWDTPVNGSGTLRMRALTRDSGYWGSASYNTGYNGFGTGIYINNPGDRQTETSGVNGGYSLRADWLNTAGSAHGHWDGPIYRPPGVLIELLGNKIRLTRNDGNAFVKPNGQPINGATGIGGNVLELPLADAARRGFIFPDGTAYINIVPAGMPTLAHDGDDANAAGKPFKDQHSYGVNVIIMAEGNVRVKGSYGAITDPAVADESGYDPTAPDDTKLKLGRVHLTIVSGGTAYIDGNVVKGDGYVSNGKVFLERGSTCAIMAKDYVCVNTTTFMAPQNQTATWDSDSPEGFHAELGLTRSSLDESFSFGVPVDGYVTSGGPSQLYLMLRHAAQPDGTGQGQTFMNLLINPALGNQGQALYQFNQNAPQYNPPGLPPETYALYDPVTSVRPAYERRSFDLRNPANGNSVTPTFVATPGYDNFFRFQVDQNAAQAVSDSANHDYLFGGAIVTPLDIRIEALLYAQENAFFIIPGTSLNPDPNDTIQNFSLTGIRPSYTQQERLLVQSGGAKTPDMQAKDRFPLYNQPLDVRITICGAIVQNYTASSGDQGAWMARWGYIPGNYGSSLTPLPDDHANAHDANIDSSNWNVNYNYPEDRGTAYRSAQETVQNITRGIKYEYDPALAMPYYRPTNMADYSSDPVRQSMALRFIQRAPIMNGNQVVLPAIRQTLPSIPRLPVCPGLLYFGPANGPIVP